jgi:hypothetical protein
MQIESIENPLILPTHLALQGQQESSCAVRGDLLHDETGCNAEEARLLLSWRVVLGEIGFSQVGAGQW